MGNLTLQQKLILEKLITKNCFIWELRTVYGGNGIYRALKELYNKGLIDRNKDYIYITHRGKRELLLWN